jgi:hypothetical protein
MHDLFIWYPAVSGGVRWYPAVSGMWYPVSGIRYLAVSGIWFDELSAKKKKKKNPSYWDSLAKDSLTLTFGTISCRASV